MSEANDQNVTLYALSTCGWCKMTRSWLDENHVEYECIYVDLMPKEEREALIAGLQERIGRRPAFPTVFRGDKFVIGFDKDQLKELLGL